MVTLIKRNMETKTKRTFAGNGLSRTAMVFKIATVAGHKLTPPELNKIKNVNPRSLEQVYNQVMGGVILAMLCLH